MRTIVIRLCDNDFGNTFRNLLETIYNLCIYMANSENLTETHIEESIREGIGFHYLAFQHNRRQFWNKDAAIEKMNFDQTVEYLKERIKILFDEKAEKFIQEHDDDGGSWYLDLRTGRVYSF